MPLTATGIGSGLDVEALVSQLVLADVGPAEQRINTAEAQYQAEISAYGLVKSALSTFQNAANTASIASQYRANLTTTSSADTLSAVASEEAVEGSYEIEITSLAASQSLASKSYNATTDQVGTGTLTILIGTSTYNSTTDSVDAFSQKSGIAAVDVVIDSGNSTLAGVRDAINASSADVVASIVNDGTGYRLVLQSDSTGLQNAFNITVADSGDGNNTDDAGLSALAFDSSATNLELSKSAGDASFSINGLTVTSASNTVENAVEGLTFSLKKETTSPETIKVSQDQARAKDTLVSFVDQFNELTTSLNTLTNYDAESSQASLLTGDSTLRRLVSSLRNLMNTSISGGLYNSLAELGVSTNVSDGTLSIDDSRLQSILDEDPSEIARVVAAFGAPSSSNVEFVAASSSTQEGTFSVTSTSTSSSGSWTAASAVTDLSYQGGGGANAAVFEVLVDGTESATITIDRNLDDGTGNLDTALLISEIDTQLAAQLTTTSATATIVNDTITITSSSSGASSSISVSGTDADNSGLGIDSGTATQGSTTYSYSINGQSASESEGVITGAAGTEVEGLQLRILGNASGDLGNVTFTRGIASQIDSFVDELLKSEGLIEARIDGLNSSIEDLGNQRIALELRADALDSRYRNQFNGLETLISQLNTTQTFLSQALSGFVEPNTTLKN